MPLTNADTLKILYGLRTIERKPGWDQKVRTSAIEALVERHYGPQRNLNVTAAFLEIVIENLEGKS